MKKRLQAWLHIEYLSSSSILKIRKNEDADYLRDEIPKDQCQNPLVLKLGIYKEYEVYEPLLEYYQKKSGKNDETYQQKSYRPCHTLYS